MAFWFLTYVRCIVSAGNKDATTNFYDSYQHTYLDDMITTLFTMDNNTTKNNASSSLYDKSSKIIYNTLPQNQYDANLLQSSLLFNVSTKNSTIHESNNILQLTLSKQQQSNKPISTNEIFTRWDLALCFLLLMYILSSFLLENMYFPILHEGTVVVLLGIAIGWFSVNQSANVGFDFDLFNYILLPPIIFGAEPFSRYFGYVMSFGIILTLGLFLFLSFSLKFIHQWHPFTTFNGQIMVGIPFEAFLIIAAVLACSDTVAVLSFIKPRSCPAAHAVVFGEGVINDVVAIILAQSLIGIKPFNNEAGSGNNENSDTLSTGSSMVFSLFYDVIYYLFTSSATGIGFGLGVSLLFKMYHDVFNHDPVRAVSLIFVGSYTSYLVSDMCGFSGILSIFLCGIVTGHYAWRSLTPTGRVLASKSASLIGFTAEAFVFGYFGVTASSMMTNNAIFSPIFIITTSLLIPFGRCVLMPPILWFTNTIRGYYGQNRSNLLDAREKILLLMGGTMRGVVSYALIIHYIHQSGLLDKNKDLAWILVTTILGTVLLNIIVLGILLPIVCQLLTTTTTTSEDVSLIRDARILLALALGTSPAPLGTTPAKSLVDDISPSTPSNFSQPLLGHSPDPLVFSAVEEEETDLSLRHSDISQCGLKHQQHHGDSFITLPESTHNITTTTTTNNNSNNNNNHYHQGALRAYNNWTAEEAALIGETLLRTATDNDDEITEDLRELLRDTLTCQYNSQRQNKVSCNNHLSLIRNTTPRSTVRWNLEGCLEASVSSSSCEKECHHTFEADLKESCIDKHEEGLIVFEKEPLAIANIVDDWWNYIDNKYMKRWFGGNRDYEETNHFLNLDGCINNGYQIKRNKIVSYQKLVKQFVRSCREA